MATGSEFSTSIKFSSFCDLSDDYFNEVEWRKRFPSISIEFISQSVSHPAGAGVLGEGKSKTGAVGGIEH